MSDGLCEAAAMDAAVMLDADGLDDAGLVPPCDESAEVDVHGFRLCVGCAEALWLFVELGAWAARRKRATPRSPSRPPLRHGPQFMDLTVHMLDRGGALARRTNLIEQREQIRRQIQDELARRRQRRAADLAARAQEREAAERRARNTHPALAHEEREDA